MMKAILMMTTIKKGGIIDMIILSIVILFFSCIGLLVGLTEDWCIKPFVALGLLFIFSVCGIVYDVTSHVEKRVLVETYVSDRYDDYHDITFDRPVEISVYKDDPTRPLALYRSRSFTEIKVIENE